MDDELAHLRELLAGQDWQAAHDAAKGLRFDDNPRLEADRLEMEAEATWWLGRFEDCVSAREAAYRLYDELGDARRAAHCAIWLYELHQFRARPSVSSGWLRRARRALEGDTDCFELGELVLRDAEIAGSTDLRAAIQLADEAIGMGRRIRSADLEAEALQTKGRLLIAADEIEEGMGHLDEAMLFAVEGRLRPYSTGKVYCSLVSACEEVGDFDRAAEWTEATMTWSQQHPMSVFPGLCRVHRAVVLKRRGDLAEAEAEAEKACEELLDSHLLNAAAAYAEVGDIRRRLGNLEGAEAALSRSQELSGRPCTALALLRLAQGRTAAAASILDGCLRAAGTSALRRGGVLPAVAQVAVAEGDLARAEAALEELDGITAELGTPELRAALLATRGRIELARGDGKAAAATLTEAVEQWQALDIPYEVATTRTLLGQALRATGDGAGAAEMFAIAARDFDQIGARLDARQLTDARGEPRPGGLTEREVEVLRLIADGLTNNEIAASLCLSPKTVSRHLSNIFTKIGVTTRASATAFAFEHDLVVRRR